MSEASQRPAPAASGRLEKTPLAHLLVYTYERKLTGTLELVAPSENASVLFIDGNPTKVRTSAAVAYLGRVLLELGHLDEPTLHRSLVQISKARRLHGQVLLEMGAIDDAKLESGLREQLLRKVQHVFSFPPESEYRYYDGFDALASYGGDELVNVDPLPLVWSAIRSAPPWQHISTALTRVTSLPLRLSRRAELARFEFGKPEQALIELLRAKPMRVAELTATEILKPKETQLLVYCLLVTRQIQVVQEGPSMPAPRLDATPTAKPSPVAASASPEQANAMSFSLRAMQASVPDRTPPQPAPSVPKMSMTTPNKPVMVPPPAVNSPSGKHPAATPAVNLSPELLARRQEILARADAIDKLDYFQMLALPRDATPDQARDAFFLLAKTWHPDRLPQPLGDVKDACARIFARLSEASATLTDAKKRERYMLLLKDGGATPEAQATIANVIEAATNFQKAEICLKRNDLAQAEALCRKAHDADPEQPDYLAMLGWLEALKPDRQSPEGTRASIQMLDKALKLNAKCERAYFYRGQLYKRIGNHAGAVRDFKNAAELNPRNIDAVREVRLFEMRKERGSIPPPEKKTPSDRPGKPQTGAGLFGKLFKK